jgi:hypothetical protein
MTTMNVGPDGDGHSNWFEHDWASSRYGREGQGSEGLSEDVLSRLTVDRSRNSASCPVWMSQGRFEAFGTAPRAAPLGPCEREHWPAGRVSVSQMLTLEDPRTQALGDFDCAAFACRQFVCQLQRHDGRPAAS